MADETSQTSTVELATELTIAWLNNANNRASADEVPVFLQRMHQTLTALGTEQADVADSGGESNEYKPAVTVRKSLSSPDHIISLIDGKPYKTLRRHLSTHGLTPEQYRERYKLKSDYPMVAKNYSEHRRAMAHKIGLGARGRKANSAPADPATTSEAAPKAERAQRKTASVGSAEKPKRASRKTGAPAPTK
jgi:predicted transcriptional regulator